MKLKIADFRVSPDTTVSLRRRPTNVKALYKTDDDYDALLRSQVVALAEQQQVLYASNSHAILVVFQAMDAAGKDGVIRHVMSGLNPQGCQVYSFNHPSAQELDHDFLWRTTMRLPERGKIGVFNRSYYEEVLIVRVHPELLAAEGVPDGVRSKSDVWKQRHASIRHHEAHLHRNGTRVVKFFLHVSKREQRKRLLERLDDPTKNWKFQAGDLTERGYWNEYMHAYEDCMEATSTAQAPWYVVPADDKKNCRLIVSQILLEHFKALKLTYPKLSAAHQRELQQVRRKFAKEK